MMKGYLLDCLIRTLHSCMGPNYIGLYILYAVLLFFSKHRMIQSQRQVYFNEIHKVSHCRQCWNLLKSFFLNSLGTKCTNTSAPSFHFQIKWSDMMCNTFDLLVFCAWAFGLYSITTMGSLGRDRIMKLKFFFFFFLSEGWWNLTV